MAPPNFGRSVNPISTRGPDYAHLITTGTPGFSDLPTALLVPFISTFLNFRDKWFTFLLFKSEQPVELEYFDHSIHKFVEAYLARSHGGTALSDQHCLLLCICPGIEVTPILGEVRNV